MLLLTLLQYPITRGPGINWPIQLQHKRVSGVLAGKENASSCLVVLETQDLWPLTVGPGQFSYRLPVLPQKDLSAQDLSA